MDIEPCTALIIATNSGPLTSVRKSRLAGWVDSTRDHGGVIFVDLRDREGRTQVVFRPEEHAEVAATAHTLRNEDVAQIVGTVTRRVEGTQNPKLATGEIEVVASSLNILNRSDVLPFPLDSDVGNEDLRLAHRYLDLRRPSLVRNLKARHLVAKVTREYLDRNGYLEIETPILSKSTPEGAREFLVPSRLIPNHYYALSQSPQQYKQLLMVGGIERYFQIAKCFRDEDPRADRITELTQIDLEASFIEREDIVRLIEGLLQEIFRATRGVDDSDAVPPPELSRSHGSIWHRQTGSAVWDGTRGFERASFPNPSLKYSAAPWTSAAL